MCDAAARRRFVRFYGHQRDRSRLVAMSAFFGRHRSTQGITSDTATAHCSCSSTVTPAIWWPNSDDTVPPGDYILRDLYTKVHASDPAVQIHTRIVSAPSSPPTGVTAYTPAVVEYGVNDPDAWLN
jgi:hypothetical protein